MNRKAMPVGSWEGLSPIVQHMVRKMLAKGVDRRYQSAKDIRIDLVALQDPKAAISIEKDALISKPRLSFLPWGVAIVALAALAVVAWNWSLRDTPPPLARWVVDPPVPLPSYQADQGANVILSPDGESAVFVSGEDGALHVKPLDRLEASELSGTEGARDPFFSPDGQWVTFFTEEALKKVALDGGNPMTVCSLRDVRGPRGGTWGEDGFILFGQHNSGLVRVPENGAMPQPLSVARIDEHNFHHWPDLLPGGETLLMTAQSVARGSDRIEAVSLIDGSRRILLHEGSFARYVLTGHLASGTKQTSWPPRSMRSVSNFWAIPSSFRKGCMKVNLPFPRKEA